MVIRRAGHLALFSGLIQLANIVMYMVLARYMTVEDFATFRQLFLIQSMLIAIVISSLPSALLYFTGSSENAEHAIYVNIFAKVVAVLAMVSMLLLFLGKDTVAWAFSNPRLSEALPYFSLAMAGFIAITVLPAFLMVFKKTNIAPLIAIGLALLMNLPVIVIAALGANFDVIIQAIGIIQLCFGIAVLSTIYMLSISEYDKHKLKHVMVNILKFVGPLVAASTIAIIGLKIDHVVVSSLLGVALYALYSVGAFEIPVFSIVQNAVTSSIMPVLTKKIKNHEVKSAQAMWRNTNKKVAWLTFPLAILFIYFAEYIVLVLFGNKYVESAPIFAIFTALVFIRVMNFGLFLRAVGKTQLELMAHIVYAVFSIAAAYYFTATFALVGAAIAVVLSTLLLSIIMIFCTAKLTEQSFSLLSVYPFKELVLGLIALVVLSIFPAPAPSADLTIMVEPFLVSSCFLLFWFSAIKWYFHEK